MSEEEKAIIERPDYENELISIIQSDESADVIRERLGDYHDNDIADVLQSLDKEDRLKTYRILGLEHVSELFTYYDNVARFIDELDIETAADVLETMDADEAVDILEELDEEKREALYPRIDKSSMEDIHLIQSYDEDEIGSRMSTNFISIRTGLSIKQAMRELVAQAADNDNISTIYVVDEQDAFYGAIDLKNLIVARQGTDLEDLIMTSYPYVYATEEIAECIEELRDYSEDSIPVLDEDKKILGVITATELVDVVDDEFGEDYAKLAGLTAEEDLNEPLKNSVRKRLPWLLLLLCLGLLVSSVVGVFEHVVAQLPLVVLFQSMVLDMAGNTGTQTLAVTIRTLTDGELTGKQKRHHILKEMRVGMTNGLLLGIFACILVGFYITIAKGKPVYMGFATSGCIAISLLVTMIISSALGSLIPMGFKKIGIDPAVASGPLITTVNDMIAVITYYGLSWVFLINLMGFSG